MLHQSRRWSPTPAPPYLPILSQSGSSAVLDHRCASCRERECEHGAKGRGDGYDTPALNPSSSTHTPLTLPPKTVHGNAAQLTQGFRPWHYHSLTSLHSRYHLLNLDYRGFRLSTGSPTEHGLILYAEAAVHWAVHTARIPPSRIVLVGHGLGTAVASAAVEVFTLRKGWDIAGVVLVAGFSSLPEMLSGYAIAGYLTVLRPLTWWPWLLGEGDGAGRG